MPKVQKSKESVFGSEEYFLDLLLKTQGNFELFIKEYSKDVTTAIIKKQIIEPLLKDVIKGKIMPFGKFKGIQISKLPSNYLRWMAENMADGPLCYAADQEYQLREKFNAHFYGEPKK